MDAFLQNAGKILETAWASATGPNVNASCEYLISICHDGNIRMISETAGWSLPALAAEHGAVAVYRVTRLGRTVRVDGWSAGRECALRRGAPPLQWSHQLIRAA